MTGFSTTRAGMLAGLVSLATLMTVPSVGAVPNQAAEQYVLINANAALDALAKSSATPEERQEAFRRIIKMTADVPRIAAFVLGRYGARVRSDPALRAQWSETFEDYALAVYQDQLEQYAGSRIRVTGSIEREVGRDVVVRSEIKSPDSGNVLSLQWRLLRGESGWKVTDISFVAEGNEVWLAQQQQREFALQLDRSNGDIGALISNVRATTVNLRKRASARVSK
jgi:phospholipid transport system substrate-binding protein